MCCRPSSPIIRPLLALVIACAAAACDSQAPTVPGGVHGRYVLRSVNGILIPSSSVYCCGSTLDSGSITVRTLDTIMVTESSTIPAGGGLPAMSVSSAGYYVLHAVGDRYALEPGAGATLGQSIDTLAVYGDTLVRTAAPRVNLGSIGQVRVYTR